MHVAATFCGHLQGGFNFFKEYITKITSLVVSEIYFSKEKKNITSLQMVTKGDVGGLQQL
jgi:hypothetical protein